ncbi:MAG: hypothetical protein IKA08_03130 [Alphaproteobacteria bacterium]|nr:hypothetical protein [Alphaproteobacteria bacterium]
MAYKDLDLRRQRGRERYARNREARKQAAREYYARNADTLREKNRIRAYESREKYKDKIHEYQIKNKDKINARCRAYYQEHKDVILAQVRQHHAEHREEIQAMRNQAKAELRNARVMCPAFKFVDKIRLADIKLYTSKYRPYSNLPHKAAKKCQAIVMGDYTLCPICKDCTMSDKKMEAVCPMPHVFEFENAVATIRERAADIVMANQK